MSLILFYPYSSSIIFVICLRAIFFSSPPRRQHSAYRQKTLGSRLIANSFIKLAVAACLSYLPSGKFLPDCPLPTLFLFYLYFFFFITIFILFFSFFFVRVLFQNHFSFSPPCNCSSLPLSRCICVYIEKKSSTNIHNA